MSQRLKEFYVDKAEQMLKAKGQEPTVNKIALMTGMSRKSVTAAREKKTTWESVPFTNVIGSWGHTLRYQDQAGKPAELAISARDEPCFSDLVREFCGQDISVSSVVDFLEESGNIERTDYGTVRLINIWATDKDLETALTHGANNLAWHAQTTIENLRILSRGENLTLRLPDRKRYSRAIPLELVPVLKPRIDRVFRRLD